MKIKGALISIIIAYLAGYIGSFFTTSSLDIWYVDIVKPTLNPPSWVFAPVWTLLYTLMGISAYIVWTKRKEIKVKTALIVYGIQLVLNALWSILFFGLQNPQLAFYEIIVLLVFIIINTVLFWRISRVAGILLVPYILWVSFATYLNFSIWMLN